MSRRRSLRTVTISEPVPPDVEPGARIPLGSVANLRSLGGWRTMDGRVVRHGRIFRSATLHFGQAADLAALGTQLGVTAVVDLRTQPEREHMPYRLPESIQPLVADVLGGVENSVPASMDRLLEEPARATELLATGKGIELMNQAYEQIVTLPSAHEAFASIYTRLADPAGGPLLFHCTTGKDRTGWASAALLLLLGVPEEDVFAEYLLTNQHLLPVFSRLFDSFAQGGGDPQYLRPVLGVERGYLETALGQVRAEYGSIQGYFTEALGLGPDAQSDLRATLLLSGGQP